MLWAVLVFVAGYLIGSVPFPVIVSRLAKGIDLRQHGTGNMGATNAARVLGKKWFPVVFGLDFVKGAAATYLAQRFLPELSGYDPVFSASLGGLAVVVGHCFPIYVGFKGGVGLAATAGALAILSPWMLLATVVSILVFWKLTKDMYMGVAATTFFYPVFAWYLLDQNPGAVAATAVWAAVVLGVHMKDIRKWIAARRAQ